MKQKTFAKVLTVVACLLMLSAFVPTQAVADQAQYIYDDLGRLLQVIDGQGNVRNVHLRCGRQSALYDTQHRRGLYV
jgi:hypothetical protein